MSPPGSTPAATSPLATRTGGREQGHLSVETLTRQAHKVLCDLDFYMSPSRISRAIRRFVREGRSDIDFRTWFISYADPTGESAVRNVMSNG